jgi:aspartyl-tRNA(Asn)/glutamyl-tRNA(Gln) amidotransferase subunit C
MFCYLTLVGRSRCNHRQQRAQIIVPSRGKQVKIDRQQVMHVAQLARLSFSEEELNMFVTQLNTILDYFDTLKDVDTRNIMPTSHLMASETPFRDDEVVSFTDNALLLQNAPSQEKGCIKVPKVIDQ